MTISRGQMKRQLYEGGGIMSLSKEGIGGGIIKGVDMGSRTGFFNPVKSLKKLGKKAVGAVKDIASSDVGKAALIGAAAFGIPGTSMGGLLGRASFGGAAPGVFGLGGIGNLFGGSAVNKALLGSSDYQGGPTSMFGAAKKFLGTKVGGNLGKFATLGAVTGFLTSTLGMSEEQAEEEVARDPSKYLSLYYKNLNPKASEEEVQEFVTSNTSEYAEGGRIGYQDAGPVLPNDPTQPVNPFAPKPTGPVLPNKAENVLSFEEFLEGKQEFMKQDNLEKLIEDYKRYLRDLQMNQARDMVAGGGIMNRMNYALGDTASQNAMQAASIEGLPMRQNPKGVQELDLRDKGGFIPPVGIKEKEDDIPAMLSNNEFVFTADAVRGMGDGDVELGAQRMYDQMKMLEAGGKV